MKFSAKNSLIAFLVLSSACAFRGTEGGNPKNHLGSDPMPGVSLYSQALPMVICEARRICTGESQDFCLPEILKNPDMTFELGVNTSYKDMEELSAAEEQKLLLVNESAYSNCIAAVKNLDCASSIGSEAFQAGDYSRIHVALRASLRCGEIFKKK